MLACGPDGASVSVGSLVSGRLVAIPFDATLSDAIAAMEGEGVRRLLVTGMQQELIGVVSIADLIEALASDMARLALSLRKACDRKVKAGLPAPHPVQRVAGISLAAGCMTRTKPKRKVLPRCCAIPGSDGLVSQADWHERHPARQLIQRNTDPLRTS